MTRRLLSACLGAVALVGTLAVPARAVAKPPDLPMNQTDTVTPQVVQCLVEEEWASIPSVYAILPADLPLPVLYQLHPTARRTLVGSLLFSVNPLLRLLPIDKALDAPGDHPPCKAKDDGFLIANMFFTTYQRSDGSGRHVLVYCGKPKKKHEKHGRKVECLPMPREVPADTSVEHQARVLMKACRLLMSEGLHEQAAELARKAFTLDPEHAMADPLIYRMHLLGNEPAKQPAGSSESCEPPSCPYCPSIGKPIPGIVPDKNKTDSGPTTLLVPPLPPVDYEVVPVFDRVLTPEAEKMQPVRTEDMPSSLEELIDLFGVDIDTDGGLRLSSECSCFGSVYHITYNRGRLVIWKTADSAKGQP